MGLRQHVTLAAAEKGGTQLLKAGLRDRTEVHLSREEGRRYDDRREHVRQKAVGDRESVAPSGPQELGVHARLHLQVARPGVAPLRGRALVEGDRLRILPQPGEDGAEVRLFCF